MKPTLFVRPLTLANPKPKRLPERNAVTIIAGFKCSEGIVLCADTQETVEGGVSKRNVPKLRYEPSEQYGAIRFPDHDADFAVAFCGAGNGPFIDKLVESAWQEAQACTSIDEVCSEIEKSIKDNYKEFGQIYQPGYCPNAQLIYGVKMHGNSKLFTANGAVVNERHEYESHGIGYYMADFLAGRMFDSFLNIHQCVILAAYILFQCREHVDGCGGESHIAVLQDNGPSGLVARNRIEAVTKLLDWTDRQTGELIIQAANLDFENIDLAKKFIEVSASMNQFRNDERINIEKRDEIMDIFGTRGKLDSFGFKKPKTQLEQDQQSDSQTSEDQR